MKTRPIFRLFSAGVCAATVAACNPNPDTTAGTGSESNSDGSTGDTDSTTSTSTSTTDGSATVDPTDGGSISNGMTMGTSEGTMTTDSTATESMGSTTMMTQPVCGNGVVEGSEECDNGPDDPNDNCDPDCNLTDPVCGNNILEVGESCDDGNNEDGDGCSGDCQTIEEMQVCGDGTVQDPETCDDGGTDPGDGCDENCQIEMAVCGNGLKEGDEQCDDGNMVDGGPMDFCKNDCTIHVPPNCQAPAMYENCDANINLADKNDKTNALKAIGVCNLQPNNSIVTTAFEFDALAKPNTWQVAKGFGTYTFDHDMDPNTPNKLLYSPREGSTFLMLSSGRIAAPNGQGIVIEANNSQVGNADNTNSDADALPAPFDVDKGSNNGMGGTPFQNCDGTQDCSDTLRDQWTLGNNNPNDRIYFTFKTIVPPGTFGYTFDFVFCSSEWPVYVNTGFNDLLIAYQVDPSADDPNQNPPVDPYTGNVTFIPDPNDNTKGLPLTITALDPYFDGPGYTFNEPQLQGTGFEQHACSDWFTAKGGVQPGAEVTIGFFLSDMSDSILATAALIDNFRWDCEGCIPSEVDDCGVQPM